jgi:hypothetical protein
VVKQIPTLANFTIPAKYSSFRANLNMTSNLPIANQCPTLTFNCS